MRAFLAVLLTACAGTSTPTMHPAPVPGGLTLEAEFVVPGVESTYVVRDAPPGATVYLGVSPGTASPGPCPVIAGGLCLDLARPVLLGTTVADAQGEAAWTLETPSSLLPGTGVTFQALAIDGVDGADSLSSAAVERVVHDLTCQPTVADHEIFGGDGGVIYSGTVCGQYTDDLYPSCGTASAPELTLLWTPNTPDYWTIEVQEVASFPSLTLQVEEACDAGGRVECDVAGAFGSHDSAILSYDHRASGAPLLITVEIPAGTGCHGFDIVAR